MCWGSGGSQGGRVGAEQALERKRARVESREKRERDSRGEPEKLQAGPPCLGKTSLARARGGTRVSENRNSSVRSTHGGEGNALSRAESRLARASSALGTVGEHPAALYAARPVLPLLPAAPSERRTPRWLASSLARTGPGQAEASNRANRSGRRPPSSGPPVRRLKRLRAEFGEEMPDEEGEKAAEDAAAVHPAESRSGRGSQRAHSRLKCSPCSRARPNSRAAKRSRGGGSSDAHASPRFAANESVLRCACSSRPERRRAWKGECIGKYS